MAVYFWGLGKNGQLGTGKAQTEHTPQPVTKLTDGSNFGQVRQVSCGALFTAIVLADGSLLTTGCNKYGRQGIGQQEEDTVQFSRVKIPAKVVQVSCGSWHASAVTEDGSLYIWGHKKACADPVGKVSTAEKAQAVALGVPLHLPFATGVKIIGVACGHNFTLCWSKDGQLFSWGRGQHGVLGHGSESDQSQPRLVDDLTGMSVISVGAGHSHCGVVLSDGRLFMAGKGSDGALGLGASRLKDALRLSHCETGQPVTSNPRSTPTQIPPEHFNGERVASVSAGGIHSAAVTSAGGVYTWGCGSDGRLGHPDGQGHRYLFRSDTPRRVEGLPDKPGTSVHSDGDSDSVAYGHCVSAAYYHTACVIAR